MSGIPSKDASFVWGTPRNYALTLKQGLEKYLTQCNEEGKTIAACHTRYYLKTIEEFISELK